MVDPPSKGLSRSFEQAWEQHTVWSNTPSLTDSVGMLKGAIDEQTQQLGKLANSVKDSSQTKG